MRAQRGPLRPGAPRPLAGLSACLAVFAVVGMSAPASAQSVVLSGSVLGSTPSRLGYNVGDFTNDNTASWWRYSGVNAGRMFTAPLTLTPSAVIRSQTNASLNASTEAEFIARRDALRTSGTASTYIDWSAVYTRYTTGTAYGNNEIDAQFADATIRAAGGTSLVVMQRSPSTYAWPASASSNTATDWQNRWFGWQQWYAQAFVRARYEDVSSYQFFNEPDLYTGSLTQDQWIQMVQYGANAVESAVADVNRLFGKNLTPHVYGPVTNGPAISGTSTDWGNRLLDTRNTPVLSSTAVPGYQLFDRYDYHNYGSSPTTFGTKLAGANADVNTLTDGNGADYPVTLSEFNTRTSANYNPNDAVNNPNGYTPDSLAMSSRLGQICANLANNSPEELYLFKFTNSGSAYNGVHWQSDAGNVGGAMKSAMVYNLFTEGFTGNDLLVVPTATSGTEVILSAAQSPSTGMRYLFAANANLTAGKTLSLDLTPWGVAPGTVVTVEQVSDLYQGGVSQMITVGANRVISVLQDPGGVSLVRVPTAAETWRTIKASQDAFVNQGQPNTTFDAADIYVQNSGTSAAGRDVAYLKFSLADIDPSSIRTALLGIYAWDPGAASGTSAGIITHVYGLTDNSWTAGSLTWNNAPNLGDPGAVISTIDQNYVTGVGLSAEIVGQFAAGATERLLQVDVSSWIASRLAAGATEATFMIAREIRYDGDVNASQSLAIRGTEYASGAYAPTLMISAVPEPSAWALAVCGLGAAALTLRRRPRQRKLPVARPWGRRLPKPRR